MVFPTGVGMFLTMIVCGFAFTGLPHRRGDVSKNPNADGIESASSPQAWGCFS